MTRSAPRAALFFGFVSLMATVALLATGCADGIEDPPPIDHRIFGLDAICEVEVDGVGRREVEGDYLAHVVACENGAADFEALKAQAVAARSYMYYKVETAGRIGDGQHDQVYTCRAEPRQIHYDAVAQTEGEVLMYRGVVVAAFYVAGAIPSMPDCVARAGDNDPTNTERYVTYNQGRAGDDLIQTSLGFVDRRNLRNRGCKSQNGANCLSRAGRTYRDIVHFYYGADIEITRAEGACVLPPMPDMGAPDPDMASPPVDLGSIDEGMALDEGIEIDAGRLDEGIARDEGLPDQSAPDQAIADEGIAPDEGSPALPCPTAGPAPAIIDDIAPCFTLACQGGDWSIAVAGGFNGGLTLAPTIDAPTDDCQGRWRFAVATAGEYTVAAYLPPTGRLLSTTARYRVAHASGESEVIVDQSQGGWLTLGTYAFEPNGMAAVSLGDATGEAFNPEGPQVAFDAIRVEPANTALPDAGPDAPDRRAVAEEGCATAPARAPVAAWPLLLVGLGWWARRRVRRLL